MPPIPQDLATLTRAAVRARLRALAVQRSLSARADRMAALRQAA